MNTYLGYEEGDVCNRDGCKGIIVHERELDGCSCHINAPCSYCTDDNAKCPSCGWENKLENDTCEYHSSDYKIEFKNETENIVEDDGNLYKVVRYFDSCYEGIEGDNLKHGEALRLFKKCNSRDRCYVSYEMMQNQSEVQCE